MVRQSCQENDVRNHLSPNVTRKVSGIKKYVKAAPIKRIPAMIYNTADGSDEIYFAHTGIFGPKYPPRLPIELTMPIPAAAAVPAKNADGNGQNSGMDPTTPSVPTDKKHIARMG